jgi:STE24 endopeptidase
MHTFTLIFLVLLTASVATQLWLAQRQIQHVLHRRDRVPHAFEDQVPLPAHRKAADYTVARTRLGQFETVFQTLLLLGWTLGAGLDALDRVWRGLASDDLIVGTGFLVSLVLLLGLLDAPLDWYRTFRLEKRFGFNRTTASLYLVDTVKKTLIALVLAVPLVWTALWLMNSAGVLWWLYVWALWMGFSLLMVWAYPTWIAPLFNRFKPLERDSLRQRLQGLLTRTGFRSDGIYVVDSSRRTTHGNAYFTGFGRSKRVVFFDSLLEQLAEREVEAVVAHELGHFKRRHVAKRIGLIALMSLVGLMVLGWLAQQSWFYSGLGVGQRSNHAALALFMLVSPVFTFFLNPLFAYGSRRHEYEADAFAVEQSDADALVSGLVKLYKENAATLTPDPLHSAFYDSHPPALARIARLTGKA